jgi:hypothetical protein
LAAPAGGYPGTVGGNSKTDHDGAGISNHLEAEGEEVSEVETNEQRAIRLERENKEREEQLRRVPFQKIDKSKWPQDVRPIAMGEADGLGIDASGRLYWNGKPVEIVGRRIDLTTTQNVIAISVAIFTALAAAGTLVQAAVTYHDWACKAGRTAIVSCTLLPMAKGQIGAD